MSRGEIVSDGRRKRQGVIVEVKIGLFTYIIFIFSKKHNRFALVVKVRLSCIHELLSYMNIN